MTDLDCDMNGKGVTRMKTLSSDSISMEQLHGEPPINGDCDLGQPAELEADSDDSSDSTCTILQQRQQQQPEAIKLQREGLSLSLEEVRIQEQHDEDGPTRNAQILSISNLTNVFIASNDDHDADDSTCEERQEVSPLVEIDLNCAGNHHQQQQESVQEEEVNMQFAAYRSHHDDTSGLERPPVLLDNQQMYHHHQSANHQSHQQQQQLPFTCNGAAGSGGRGFSEAQPKLSFASQRVKEYFESFKSHRGETVRLYQFFKSTRTELVACLLFSLITSQALIVLRTNNSAPASREWPPTGSVSTSHQLPAPVTSLPTETSEGSARASVQLANGLAMSLTVASLTQVFGHISGCHLLPSISLALYIKGHISRARLASYLVAQFAGSGLGVTLLSLLSSSQLSPAEYSETLRVAATLNAALNPAISRMHTGSGSARGRRKRGSPTEVGDMGDADRLGDMGDMGDAAAIQLGPGSETILLSIIEQQQQEKTTAQQHNRNLFGAASDNEAAAGGRSPSRAKTISAGTYPEAPSSSSSSLPPPPTPPEAPRQDGAPNAVEAQTPSPAIMVAAGKQEAIAAAGSGSIPSPTPIDVGLSHMPAPVPANGQTRGRPDLGDGAPTNDRSRAAATAATTIDGSSWRAPPLLGSQRGPDDATAISGSGGGGIVQRVATSFPEAEVAVAAPSGLIGANLGPPAELAASTSDLDVDGNANSNKRVRLRRRKRKDRQAVSGLLAPPAAAANSSNGAIPAPATTNNDIETGPSSLSSSNLPVGDPQTATASEAGRYYINLLEFALPDQIMSGESIRQCIDKQAAAAAKWTQPPSRHKQQQQPEPEQEALRKELLASKSFGQCLSLSNSSQMFVFQFVASLLVVLTYLVNVDPRRVDLGFKSLSIGLAYFVACVLTVNSGSFFGNPFHLLFLNWLSTTSEWRSEWLIYLITPLISGLFGAISHEYIDFSSLRNRNKQLHLRRSFYSLDNLPQIVAAGTNSTASARADCVIGGDDSHATVVEIASIHRAARKAPSSASSSLESVNGVSAGSMMSLSDGYPPLAATSSACALQVAANQPLNLESHYSNIKPPQRLLDSENRKLASHSRQLRQLERQQQQLQRVARAGCAPLQHCATTTTPPIPVNNSPVASKPDAGSHRSSPRRTSDFDSNFLISSSSSSPPTASKRQQVHAATATTTTSGWM